MLALSLAALMAAGCHASRPVERPTWPGTEGSLQPAVNTELKPSVPTAREELTADNNHVSELGSAALG